MMIKAGESTELTVPEVEAVCTALRHEYASLKNGKALSKEGKRLMALMKSAYQRFRNKGGSTGV